MNEDVSRTAGSAAGDLREEGQQRPGDPRAEGVGAEADVRALLAELRLHQSELERQNETLQRARAEAQEASQQYRDLFHFAPIGYFMLDEAGLILEINFAGAALLGVERAACLAVPFGQFVASPDQGVFTEFLRRTMAADHRQTCELRLLGNSGPLYVLVEGTSVHERQGQSKVCCAAVIDMTHQKLADESLRRAKAAAEQANRAKDHFLAVLSHELRTPLTPVVMGMSLLKDRSDLDPAALEIIEMVHRSVELEARLIDDLLDVSRIAGGRMELVRRPVDVGTAIRRAIEVCRPDIEARGLHFDLDCGVDSPYWVNGDMARLQQVFWNLLKNAIKFTPSGGSVSVRYRAEAGFVQVEVTDSGIGIEWEALARIFSAFEQGERYANRQFGGLGLGLAISRSLVELHGGGITAHSAGLNRGATFRVRLPLATSAGRVEHAPHFTWRNSASHPARILLVEDHAVTAGMVRMALADAGHTVEVASDVAEALALAERQPFDLLLSDLGLPDGSGYDLFRQLRDRGQQIPAIALSGYGQEDDLRRSREAGFAAHLTKPASREALVEAVADALTNASAAESPGR